RAASCSWGLLWWPVTPDGSRSLHALTACLNAAEFVSRDEPFATASMVNAPDASGSGNAPTPLARMHSANFTAFARVVAVLLIPLLTVPGVAAVSLPPLLRVPPQPALTTAMARAATAHVFRLTTRHPLALPQNCRICASRR